MFTGIVQEVGFLLKKERQGSDYKLTVKADKITSQLTRGESVAVNGTCLTVEEYGPNSFQAHVMPETVNRTNLRKLEKGSAVNLELPVKPDGFFGGHMVTGHVDGHGLIEDIYNEGKAKIIEVKIDSSLEKYMVQKGSVALNGVSLTIADLQKNLFRVSLIPETVGKTNLNLLETGDEVNIETDLIGKYVVKMMEKNEQQSTDKSRIDRKFLQEKGFI